jgi:hypothetical protein
MFDNSVYDDVRRKRCAAVIEMRYASDATSVLPGFVEIKHSSLSVMVDLVA